MSTWWHFCRACQHRWTDSTSSPSRCPSCQERWPNFISASDSALIVLSIEGDAHARINELTKRVAALEDAHRAPRPAFEKCNGDHHGHPCADPECWILRRYKEQQNGQ